MGRAAFGPFLPVALGGTGYEKACGRKGEEGILTLVVVS